MAECRQTGGKGKRANQRGSKSARQQGSTEKSQEIAVEGYGVDRLRAAAERRMAENSDELAETLMTKALQGKLESVKILMKLAEEEKARKEEEIVEDTPGLADLLIGSVVKIGQMWDGHRWVPVAKSRILEEGCAKWEDIFGSHREPVRDDDDDDLEEAA